MSYDFDSEHMTNARRCDIEDYWTDLRAALLNDRGHSGAIEFLSFAIEVLKREKYLTELRAEETVLPSGL